MMLVRGVRRSWETARSRLARIFSFSASMRSFSCSRRIRFFSFKWVVVMLVRQAMISMEAKVTG